MPKGQHRNKRKIIARASRQGRIIAAWIFIIGLAIWFFFVLADRGYINLGRIIGPCGMKMRTGLPCPTCGFTTAALAFFRGDIIDAFYIQPAAALLYSLLVIAVFFAFMTAVFGLYFTFLKNLAGRIKAWQIVLAIIIILAGGWVVTLSRALAQKY